MYDFKKIAQARAVPSVLMIGREKLTYYDMEEKIVTITGFDFAKGAKIYPVLLFDEYPGQYYIGGQVLHEICKAWADEFGDVKKASELLKESGGVKVRLENDGLFETVQVL